VHAARRHSLYLAYRRFSDRPISGEDGTGADRRQEDHRPARGDPRQERASIEALQNLSAIASRFP
jgi:hypothetical protein